MRRLACHQLPVSSNSTRRLDLPCSLTAYGWRGRLLQNDPISSVHNRYILLRNAQAIVRGQAPAEPPIGKDCQREVGLDWIRLG
jgi:hypothetical protein